MSEKADYIVCECGSRIKKRSRFDHKKTAKHRKAMGLEVLDNTKKREYITNYMKEYRKSKPEKHREAGKRYYQNNKDNINLKRRLKRKSENNSSE